jgi:hypothetical protein
MSVMKRCNACGVSYDVAFFRRDHSAANTSAARSLRGVCIGCEQTKRDASKGGTRDGRWLVKIRDVIRRHATRLRLSIETLEQEYGWRFDRMLHEAQHAYANGCAYCGKPFRDMGHGLNDLSLDIRDRDEAPYYVTNVEWACQTCNRSKSTMSAAEWAAKLASWEKWKRRPVQRKLWD